MNLVTTAGLCKNYGAQPVLQNVNITVEPGSIVGLLGPNGCGKTTLFKIIAGLIRDYKGEVRVEGREVGVLSKAAISYLPEKTYLPDWMRARDAVSLFADFYADFDRARAEEMMQRFHLTPEMSIHSMSKGMQEKLQLLLVMSRRAKLFVLDEPLGGVDPASRSMILDTILTNYTEDASLLISTHLIYDIERVFDRVIMMGYGQIIMDDTVDNIRAKYGKTIDEVFKEVFRC